MNNANELMVQVGSVGVDGLASFDSSTTISNDNWLNSQNKLEVLHELRVMALGNAKILYGSEKFKHYDVVVAFSKSDAIFAAILVCTFNEETKILRKEIAGCPLAAVRAIVQGLHCDTGLLLAKYDIGDQLRGQQGSTKPGGDFELFRFKNGFNDPARDHDDTSTLTWGNPQPPAGPRLDRYSVKRTRGDNDRSDYRGPGPESRESEGILKYED